MSTYFNGASRFDRQAYEEKQRRLKGESFQGRGCCPPTYACGNVGTYRVKKEKQGCFCRLSTCDLNSPETQPALVRVARTESFKGRPIKVTVECCPGEFVTSGYWVALDLLTKQPLGSNSWLVLGSYASDADGKPVLKGPAKAWTVCLQPSTIVVDDQVDPDPAPPIVVYVYATCQNACNKSCSCCAEDDCGHCGKKDCH